MDISKLMTLVCPTCKQKLPRIRQADVEKMKKMRANGKSVGYIATKFAISTSYASDIINGKRKVNV